MSKDSLKTFSSLTKAQQKEFKERWLCGEGIKPLAEEFGVKRTSAQYYANSHWADEKEMLKAELFQAFTKTKQQDFIELSQSSIVIMKRALEDLARRATPPSIMEAKRATEILEALDKITRLDEGRPTDISEAVTITVDDLKDKLSIDPFANIKQVENKSNDTEKNTTES